MAGAKRNKKDEDKHRVSKKLFTSHADFECSRNVFLNLSQVAADWDDYRTWRKREGIKRRERNPVTNKLITERGRQYEQEVYAEIIGYGDRMERRHGSKVVFASVSQQDSVWRTIMVPQTLRQRVNQANGLELVLLEHELELSDSFQQFFPNLKLATARPDIVTIRPLNQLQGTIRCFDEDGEIIELSKGETTARYGISIVDIKSIPEDRVGHKYFNEVLYYLRTINHFIHDHDLDEFLVLADGNGILPTIDNIKIYDFYDLREKMVEVEVEQTMILYENTIDLVTNQLLPIIPVDRNKIQQTFGSHCDKCPYLDDCLINSGYDQENDQWDDQVEIELLPNVNNSIISQLKEDNITSVEDLVSQLDMLREPSYPKPINAILPLLKHKSKAITKKSVEYADSSEIYSTSIPPYSRTKVTFTLETDSTTDLAFGFGILLESSMGIRSKAKHKELFGKWWKSWKEYLDNNETYSPSVVETLHQQFQTEGFLDIPISDVKHFAKHLHFFESSTVGDNKSLKFVMPGDELPSGRLSRQTRIELAYVNISLNITKEAERVFLEGIISTVARVIQMTLIMERNIKSGESFANTAFYYWSQEIVEKIEDLLEKHMGTILDDIDLYNDLFLISQWISPSNQVTDPNQLKRIYDLSKFVESVMGIPLPINYTWHRTARVLLDQYGYNSNYWSPLFNNMDRSHWHMFIMLRETDQSGSNKKYKDIQSQLYSKVRTMAILVNHFQFNDMSRALISSNPVNTPREVKTRATDILPRSFHPLARNWYLFATLTESVDELEKVELRSTYPEAAVGRLEAAEVSDLRRIDIPGAAGRFTYIYEFKLEGLSRNVKFSDGDRVILIPIAIRDSILSYATWDWQVKLRTMSWDSTTETYTITTEEHRKDIFAVAEQAGLTNPEMEEWYIYPTTVGVWASKLFSRRNSSKSLLMRNRLGASMLGQRLAIMWNIGALKELPPLQSMTFSMAEVFMYAPDLLQSVTYPRASSLSAYAELPPDPSQEEAIHFALESPLRLILGPPGTGKSQTIVALIDEFLQRRKAEGRTENKILITSFAYTASNVLLEKICRGMDHEGNPNLAAETQKVFIMSTERTVPQLGDDGPTFKVNRLVKQGKGWNFDSNRITPKSEKKLEDYTDGNVIYFGNAHQVFKLDDSSDDIRILSRERLEFDLIIVDEASQLPTDHMLSIYQHLISGEVELAYDFPYQGGTITPVELESMKIINPEVIKSHVVLVGDDNQLPPVQPIKPPDNLQVQLGSVFDYYKSGFNLEYRQLKFNYRSHKMIVDFTASLGIYDELLAAPSSPNREKLLPGDLDLISGQWTEPVLDPSKVVVSLIHDTQYDTSVSIFEAEIAVKLILDYFKMINPRTEQDQIRFWYESIGIVAPHNAHSRTIINMLNQRLIDQDLNVLSSDNLMEALKSTIFSVEKFQGSERDVIIGSVGVSSKEQLKSEEEFIYDLNRINVLTTRAKSKMILICSKNFLSHIPQERDRFFDISILKNYTYKYCDHMTEFPIPHQDRVEDVEFYWKSVR